MFVVVDAVVVEFSAVVRDEYHQLGLGLGLGLEFSAVVRDEYHQLG